MPEHPTAAEVVELRAPIEEEHNKYRDDLEKQYVEGVRMMEDAYLQQKQALLKAKQDALVAAGLNPDGSTVSTRKQQGSNI